MRGNGLGRFINEERFGAPQRPGISPGAERNMTVKPDDTDVKPWAKPKRVRRGSARADRRPGGRPRKKATDAKTAKLEVRLTEEEKALFHEKAEANGLSASEWLRRLGSGHQIRPQATAVDLQLIAELNAIGVNINQIARAVNRGRESPAPLDAVAAQIRAILDEVAERL